MMLPVLAIIVFLLPASFWPAANGGPQADLLRDARITHDLATIETAGAERRVVLRIIPATNSGSATEDGTIREEGTWELLFSGPGVQMQARGNYRWAKQGRFHEGGPTLDSMYSPFSQGGIILCEFHADASGAEQFVAVTMLPEVWVPRVKETLAGVGQAANVASRSALERMARGANPLAACIAFRRLLSMLRRPETALTASTGYQRAVYSYLMLVNHSDLPKGAAHQALQRLAVESETAESRKFTALGLFSARLVRPELAQECPWTFDILRALEQRIRLSGGGADPYFVHLFELMRAR
jgi:hypothetical protein